ncbi:unnamed protein product [Parajaminaea phylloscopi]
MASTVSTGKRVPSGSSASGSAVRPGGNWKALKKTLDTASDAAQPGRKRRRASSLSRPTSNYRTDKGKARAVEYDNAGDPISASSSPAPTGLPWFAEDLSPEDLALVQHVHGSDARVSSAPRSATQWNATAESSTGDSAAKLRKEIILGGRANDDSEAKREPGQYVAIDCEMVGVGPKGSESVLARVSIVNWHGHVLLDRFVRPMEKVTDYRTWVSGIRAKDLKGAPTLKEVQDEVSKLIKGRVLVGHAIQNDLKALLLSHPRPLVRDTATFKPLRDLAQTKYPGLKKLAKLVLDIDMQGKGEEHSSVEDARTTMAIFRTQKDAWEKTLKSKGSSHDKSPAKVGAGQPDQTGLPAGKAQEGDRLEKKMREQSGRTTPVRRKRATEATPNWWKEGI